MTREASSSSVPPEAPSRDPDDQVGLLFGYFLFLSTWLSSPFSTISSRLMTNFSASCFCLLHPPSKSHSLYLWCRWAFASFCCFAQHSVFYNIPPQQIMSQDASNWMEAAHFATSPSHMPKKPSVFCWVNPCNVYPKCNSFLFSLCLFFFLSLAFFSPFAGSTSLIQPGVWEALRSDVRAPNSCGELSA